MGVVERARRGPGAGVGRLSLSLNPPMCLDGVSSEVIAQPDVFDAGVHRGHREREQRADDPEQFGANCKCEEHGEIGEPQLAAVHSRADQIILRHVIRDIDAADDHGRSDRDVKASRTAGTAETMNPSTGTKSQTPASTASSSAAGTRSTVNAM